MKVIDLVSINKKEMPKCVKHYSGIYVWDKKEGDFFKKSGEGLLQWCVSSFDTQNHFIDEVEIIEEDKKIEKLEHMNSRDYLENRDEYLSTKDIALDIETLRHWINKIIDYLEEK